LAEGHTCAPPVCDTAPRHAQAETVYHGATTGHNTRKHARTHAPPHAPKVLRMAQGSSFWRSTPADVTNTKRFRALGQALIRLSGPSRSVGRGPLSPTHLPWRVSCAGRGAAVVRTHHVTSPRCVHCGTQRQQQQLAHMHTHTCTRTHARAPHLLEGKAVVPVQQQTAATPATSGPSVDASRRSPAATCDKRARRSRARRRMG
jgi:hypothetical protein